MAVDTALKRGSAVYVGLPWRSDTPLPDGTISRPDRNVLAFMYSGIMSGAADATITNIVDIGDLFIMRSMDITLSI